MTQQIHASPFSKKVSLHEATLRRYLKQYRDRGIALQLNLGGGYFKWHLMEQLKNSIEIFFQGFPKEMLMTLLRPHS